MLGWVAATGNFGIEAGTLFLIQFFWQFHILGGWFCMKIMKRQVSLCCLLVKDKGTALQVIYIQFGC
jgi:protoheme IX farnesyltransferase